MKIKYKDLLSSRETTADLSEIIKASAESYERGQIETLEAKLSASIDAYCMLVDALYGNGLLNDNDITDIVVKFAFTHHELVTIEK